MTFPKVSVADWRALVDKELAGASFEKTLVQQSAEGIPLLPLYTEAPKLTVPPGLFADASRDLPFRICMRHSSDVTTELLVADVEGGADALWMPFEAKGVERARIVARKGTSLPFWVFDAEGPAPKEAFDASARFAWGWDPIYAAASGQADTTKLVEALAHMGEGVARMAGQTPHATSLRVSTLPFHDAGCDVADELAFALSGGAAYLNALLEAGLSPVAAGKQISLQLSVGRDTFSELCKVRALRICWGKLLAAAGVTEASRTLVHAVCSSRTLAARDPWVNLLRVTTQMFSAVLGGADLVTPNAFDGVLGRPSELGHRTARNTGLVLRDESGLGKVMDPAGGSYFFETLTDQIAREAWKRFQTLEREGGIVQALESGALQKRLEAAWQQRLELLVKRKASVLGVSDFANLKEVLPPRTTSHPFVATKAYLALPAHRDSEAFEALRDRAQALDPAPEAVLVTLGSLAESRPRVGFAMGFFAAGGIASRETSENEVTAIACLCGTDERYAEEAVRRVRDLKAEGCRQVLVAGRPGALEASLREAGADGFLFVGCDAVAMLSELLATLAPEAVQ